MVKNTQFIKSDKEFVHKIINEIIAKELKKGKRISIQQATQILTNKLQGQMDELLEDKFIKF